MRALLASTYRADLHLIAARSATSTLMLSLALLLAVSPTCRAVTRSWNTFGSGNFNDAANWFPFGVPAADDFSVYAVGFGGTYSVTFPGNPFTQPLASYSTAHFRARSDTVTLAQSTSLTRGPSRYSITSPDLGPTNRSMIVGWLSGDNATVNDSLAELNAVGVTIGDAAGATGTLNVNLGTFNITGSDGVGSAEREFIVGRSGTGTLQVRNGADVRVSGFVGNTSVGDEASGIGSVVVSGSGSTFTQEYSLWVGHFGRGSFTIENGGSFIGNTATTVGNFQDSNGTINVRGTGSTWSNESNITLGTFGQAFMNIELGGVVTNANAFLATTTTAVARVSVTGAGSRWDNSNGVYIGGDPRLVPGVGDAIVNVSDGGVLSAGGYVRIYSLGSLVGDGTIEGDVINEGSIEPGNSAGMLTVTGDYTQDAMGFYYVEVFGTQQGSEYDLLEIGGTATLAGVMDVDISNSDYVPTLGDSFEVLRAAGGVVGQFDGNAFPLLGGNLQLVAQYGTNNVTLVIAPIQAGDFNADARVDAADYTVWRDSLGASGVGLAADVNRDNVVDTLDYQVWRGNFGESPLDGGSLVDTSIPEPGTLLLGSIAAGLSMIAARRLPC